MQKIYCAGPLFNNKEKEEMQELADILELNNFRVFLPHRDGFEFANLQPHYLSAGFSSAETTRILNQAIFTLDVFHVLDSDGLLLNMNGRVPDEGAMVEAGIAWNAGKKIVIYKNDSRSLINGNDNPLLLGLAEFKIVNNIPAIPAIFNDHFTRLYPGGNSNKIDNSNVKRLYQKGQTIAALAEHKQPVSSLCSELVEILGV